MTKDIFYVIILLTNSKGGIYMCEKGQKCSCADNCQCQKSKIYQSDGHGDMTTQDIAIKVKRTNHGDLSSPND